jgi:hypothetical protein
MPKLPQAFNVQSRRDFYTFLLAINTFGFPGFTGEFDSLHNKKLQNPLMPSSEQDRALVFFLFRLYTFPTLKFVKGGVYESGD